MPHLETEANDRACYRYRTSVLIGPWRRDPDRAIEDAIAAGQASRNERGDLRWIISGEIETSPCEPEAACGGVYPPD